MLALNVPLLVWVFGCACFQEAEPVAASPSAGGPAEATNALTSATLITPPTSKPPQQMPERHSSALAEGQATSAAKSAAGDVSEQLPATAATTDWSTSPSLSDPAPTEEKSALTMAAFGVISFIVILVVVVIVLVSVVSLRFKCNRAKDAEDKQKPGSSGVSESCSAATAKKGSVTLISMKDLSMNNSAAHPTSEKVL